jgi:hypothetical protein
MKSIFCTLLCFVFLSTVQGQGWEKSYPLSLTSVWGLTPMPDGGSLITAHTSGLIRLGPDGAFQWMEDMGEALGVIRPVVLPATDGGMLFLGRDFNNINQVLLVKTDANLNVIWSKHIAAFDACPFCDPVFVPVPGGYVLSWLNLVDYSPVTVVKLDLQGDVVWEKTYAFGDYVTPSGMRYFRDLTADSQGNLYLSGQRGNPYEPLLAKLSANGDSLFLKNYPQGNPSSSFTNIVTLNDNLIVARDYFRLNFLDSSGTLLNAINLPSRQIRAASDGNLLVGDFENANLRISKVTPSGSTIWSVVADDALIINGTYSLWEMPDGGCIALGSIKPTGASDPYVIRTDANGITFTNRLQGNVFADLDNNCTETGGDLPASELVVMALKGNDSRFATTDSAGNFSMTVDTGTYLLSVVPPNQFWNVCTDSIPLTFIGSYDTVQTSIGVNSDLECPWPEIEISIPFLRRCSPLSSVYTIAYKNLGNVTAYAAVVRVTLDPFLNLLSASAPYTVLGPNVYGFAVGDILPLKSGSIKINVEADCATSVLGQTHCTSAELVLDNFCIPGQEPVVRVDAECTGDSVQFTLSNVGDAPMPQEAEFIVIEDLIVMREGAFQLDAQQDTVLKCPANGATFRIYAGYEPGALPFFAPTAAVEGCNGPLQPGLWNVFPEYYPTRFARHCRQNQGPYDPNDKQGFPTGFGPSHYIGEGVALDYMIRFQNTGTDTAVHVVIRDTLSAWLDPASVRPGPASHPYTWALLGQNVLEFTFDNIFLPDSFTNLATSQGFIQFGIGQKPGVPLETDILNQAAIYFDYNPPIFTNTTQHRVGKDFILTVDTWSPEQAPVYLRAWPNPVSEFATVVLEAADPGAELEWTLTDVAGQTFLRQTTRGNRWDFRREGMPSGIYWLQVRENGKMLGKGKLVIH